MNRRKVRFIAPSGENHHRAKITDHEVELIRGLRKEGWDYLRLALKFEISKSQVRNIIKGYQRF